MAYLAIARKWRPNRFEDLVGQEHVVQTLKNAIRLDRVSHAYLFSGARGVGKTSVARIFAKALRCPNAKEAMPCNDCAECQAIAESRSVDVMEIDGASNNGVESVRGIRDNVAYGAASGKYKVYIIDEVHMLSISAFNALLKTLEEPPANVLFLFATTEVQKIPLTILSRCQRFEFRRLSNVQILERLNAITAAESVHIAEEGLRTIANQSDGSLRDALSLLDQVLSFCAGQTAPIQIDNSVVVDALGVKDLSAVSQFLASILRKDIKAVLHTVGDVYFSGIDLKHFAEKLLEELRLLYLVALGLENKTPLSADELDVPSSHLETLKEMAKQTPLIELERMAQILGKAIPQLGWSSLPRFVLEMAAVRMTKLDGLSKIEAALLSGSYTPVPTTSAPSSGHSQVQTPAKPAPAKLTNEPREPKAFIPAREIPEDSNRGPNRPAPPPPTEPPPAATFRAAPPPPPSSYNPSGDPAAQWKAFVDATMKRRPLLGALLCHAGFKMDALPGGNKQICLAFAPGSFYERQATDTKNRTEIEESLKNFFGRDTVFQLSNSLGETAKSIEEVHQAETAEIKKSGLEDPNVLKMKQILGADVVDVSVEP